MNIIRLFKFFSRLTTKLIAVPRKISPKPITMKSNKLQLISSEIKVPIKGINSKKRGYSILFVIFGNNKLKSLIINA